jgi:hypothetical protein
MLLKILKSHGAWEKVTDNQQRPARANNVERSRYRTRCIKTVLCHSGLNLARCNTGPTALQIYSQYRLNWNSLRAILEYQISDRQAAPGFILIWYLGRKTPAAKAAVAASF